METENLRWLWLTCVMLLWLLLQQLEAAPWVLFVSFVLVMFAWSVKKSFAKFDQGGHEPSGEMTWDQ